MPIPSLLPRSLVSSLALTGTFVVGSIANAGPLPGMSHQVQPHPVHSTSVKVDPVPRGLSRLEGTTPPAVRSGALTEPQKVSHDLAVVGVTWAAGALVPTDILQVRSYDQGSWGAWQTMDREKEHGPDTDGPGGAEGRRVQREGTAPVVVDGEQAQVRVLTQRATVPTVSVSVIDPGTAPADATVGTAAPGAATAAASRPTILTRAQWGADESIRKGGVGYGQAQIAFVHHTDGTNSYTSAQVPAIIRGIYAYHVNGQGWNDIGYNFLVDRFGRIWEGRYGGVDKAVIGAQTLNYNSWSFGVAAIGTFSTATPPSAMVTAIERVIAWKFTIHGIPATGTVYARDKYFNRISGHRDGYATACPGQVLYDRLPTIRRAVSSMIGTLPRSKVSRSVDAGTTPDLLSYEGTLDPPTMSGPGTILRAASTVPVANGVRFSTKWNVLRSIALSPDFTGDGNADIVAIDPKVGALRVYAGDGRGGISAITARGTGWTAMTRLVGVGDRTGDGHPDLVAVRNDGVLALYAGDGQGWVSSWRAIGTGFGAMSSVMDAGDVDDDGLPDLLAVRSSDGALLLYRGAADGGILAPVAWGSKWNGLSNPVAGPDLDGDGNSGDVVARQPDGRMRTYYADPAGRLSRVNVWGSGWSALDNIMSGADWNGDGREDILARVVSNGDLRLYAGTGQRDFSPPPLTLRTDLADVNLMRVLGDLDGDGLADAVARTSAGDLYALKGRGDGSFATHPATRIGHGWGGMDLLEAGGDLSNDGVPDLIARTTAGELRLYTMTRAMTVGWSMQLAVGWQGMRSVTGAGALNSDYNADVVALRDSDGAVLVYRGTGPGTLNDGKNDFVVTLTGQTSLTRLLGVGDFNGDSRNDLIAEDTNGKLWLYPGDGTKGFGASRQPVRSGAVGDVLG